jgi:hypothetical protein
MIQQQGVDFIVSRLIEKFLGNRFKQLLNSTN